MPVAAQPAELALVREASETVSAALAAIAHIPTASSAHARAALIDARAAYEPDFYPVAGGASQ